jgi:spore germination protein KC
MKRVMIILLNCCLLFIVTGCFGIKELQNQTYATALAIDFKEDKFTVYFQALNFSNIAKQEGGAVLQQKAPVLIGEASAGSIKSAMSILDQKTALPIFYGHTNTLLLTKSVTSEQLEAVMEYVGQEPKLRYNTWVFGTNENIKDILNSDSFFNLPSLFTTLHNPTSISDENFFIKPLKFNQFISRINQPVGSVLIPTLSNKNNNFTEDGKPKKVPFIEGVFVLANKQYKGYVDKKELSGLKWLSANDSFIPLSLNKEKVNAEIENPQSKIKVISNKKPLYDIRIKGKAALRSNQNDILIDEAEKMLEKRILHDIHTTLKKGEEMGVDLLNISEKAYRFHFKQWDIKTINEFNEDSINHINVSIHIEHSQNYK